LTPCNFSLRMGYATGVKTMARKLNLVKAFGYLRTSSDTNVGSDKDSEPRQRAAITGFAKRAGFEVVEWFYDADVKGEVPIQERPEFARLLDRLDANGVRTVLIEDVSRLSRLLMIQETGIMTLIARQVKVLASNGDDLTETDDEMRIAMRQIAGTFSQLEKTRLVKKLRLARERKKAQTGKCGGRHSMLERDPYVVREAKRLAEEKHRSLREIASELQVKGHQSNAGTPFGTLVVQRMLAVAWPDVERGIKAYEKRTSDV
jgi:DNA invertase Pin-like site-specific DNA recombinase